jgi:hypothetical protein
LIYQSGSGTGSVLLIDAPTLTGSNSAIVQIFGATYLSGGIFDSFNTTGSVNQVLVSTGGTGIKWVASSSGGTTYDPTNLNAATNSLQLFSASILTFTASLNAGNISGSGGSTYLPYYKTNTGLSQSLIYQSGSNSGSVLLINPITLTGSNTALLQVFGYAFISGGLFDFLNSTGSAGQVLQSNGSQIQWVLTASQNNLNNSTSSLQNFSSSILGFTASITTSLVNVFASESNYLLTSSLSKTGINYVPYLSGSNVFTSSLIYQSGSGTGSVLLIDPPSLTGSNTALVQIFGATFLSGGIFDSFNTTGSVNQVLVSTGGTGIKWVASSSGGGSTYDPTNLNAATNSLQLFSASILGFTASITTSLVNVFASESNYLLTSSLSTLGVHYIPFYSASNIFSSSLIYQSGANAGTGSVLLINPPTLTGSSNNQIIQIYGNAYLSGGLYDATNGVGSAGQALMSTGTQVLWVTTASLASLNSYTSSTNVGTISGSGALNYIPMFSGGTSVSISRAYQSGSGTGSVIFIGATSSTIVPTIFQVFGNMYLSGSLFDSTGRTGSANQVLTATSGGVSWIGPLYAQSLLLMGG